MDLRTIKLTHEEVETIKTALQIAHYRTVDVVSQNGKMLGKQAVGVILEQADKYLDTQEVFDGERDV